MPQEEEHPEQQLLAPTSDVHFLNQSHFHKPSIKRPSAINNSNQKRNKINTETQTEAHSEIVEALNSEKFQTTHFNFT